MHPLDDYCGTYQHGGYGRLSVERDGDHVVARLSTITCPLSHRSSDSFELCHGFQRGAWTLVFHRDGSGRVCAFHLNFGANIQDLVFSRVDTEAGSGVKNIQS